MVRENSDKEKWPSSKILRQGIRANGWIFLSRVSLGYELWRRFNDFPPSLPYDYHLKHQNAKEKK
jgi:membrane fusion protein, adhesin transport system